MSSLQERRDRAVADDVNQVLAHDARLGHLDVGVDIRGGVAHLAGTVPSEAERRLVRQMVGLVRGVLAVWDLVRTAGQGELRVIDVGCGGTKQTAGALGVDFLPEPDVDVVADLARGLPFAQGSVDHAFAVHVLEHVHDLMGAMWELHRVLKPTGVLHVLTPDWRFVNAVADPTHVRSFSTQTLKYFCRETGRVPGFWPHAVSSDSATVFADLQPVKDGPPPPPDVLARFFD